MTVMLCSITKTTAKAEEIIAQGNCGAAGNEVNVTWELTSDGVLTISGIGDMEDYGKEIGERSPWYEYKDRIETIDIRGVSGVGAYAFYKCGEKAIIFNVEKLDYINDYAFSDNKMLESLSLPKEIKKIGDYAFSECESMRIEKLSLPGLNELGKGAFSRCFLIFNIEIPAIIETIPEKAFEGCAQIGVVEVGEGVKRIEEYAFSGAIRIKLPSTIEYLDSNCFNGGVVYGKNEYVYEWASEKDYKYIDMNKKYDISKAEIINITDNDEYLYTGEDIKIDVVPGYQFNSGTLNSVWVDLIEGEDYIVEYSNTIYPGMATITLVGRGMFEGTKECNYSIYDNIENCNVSLENDRFLFNGEEKSPRVIVTHHGTELIEDTDYTIKYSNNKDEGTASVKITGKGSYKGEVINEFTIYKNEIIDKDCALEYSEVLFDASAKKPAVTVKYDGNDLVLGNDYKVEYADNTDVGEATVTITGMGSYKGTVTKSFSIYKYDLSKANVSLSYEDVLYDGMAKVPEITVTYDGKTLTKDKDYSVEIINNTLPGTATVRGTGVGQYSGTVEKIFTITALSIEKADVALKESIYSYDGSPKTPSVDVKLGEKMLVKDTDYILTYENNIDDGTAHAVVTGTGIYKDVIKVSFVILPYNAGMDAVYPEGTLIDDDYVYGVTDDETNEVEFFCPANQKLKSVHIPATVTDENGTVYTVTSIGNKAFYKNTQITSVVIANTVKSIEDYAFYGCKNIKTLKIGSGVEVIGNSAFRKCTKLTAVTLPKSIDSLGKNCFYGCSKLKTITIDANSVVDVKANAIKGVSKKCVIKVPKKLVKKYKKEFNKKSGFTGGMKVKKK